MIEQLGQKIIRKVVVPVTLGAMAIGYNGAQHVTHADGPDGPGVAPLPTESSAGFFPAGKRSTPDRQTRYENGLMPEIAMPPTIPLDSVTSSEIAQTHAFTFPFRAEDVASLHGYLNIIDEQRAFDLCIETKNETPVGVVMSGKTSYQIVDEGKDLKSIDIHNLTNRPADTRTGHITITSVEDPVAAENDSHAGLFDPLSFTFTTAGETTEKPATPNTFTVTVQTNPHAVEALNGDQAMLYAGDSLGVNAIPSEPYSEPNPGYILNENPECTVRIVGGPTIVRDNAVVTPATIWEVFLNNGKSLYSPVESGSASISTPDSN